MHSNYYMNNLNILVVLFHFDWIPTLWQMGLVDRSIKKKKSLPDAHKESLLTEMQIKTMRILD